MPAGQTRSTVTEIIVFAADVPDRQVLLDGLRPGVVPLVLSGSGDGLAELAGLLAGVEGLEALHIVSHGAPGRVFLGGAPLSAEALAARGGLLAAIGGALAPDGAVLLYGCEVAKGAEGRAFVAALETALGRAVMASQTLTGAAALGGDWVFHREGSCVPSVALSRAARSRYPALLTVFDFTSGIVSGDLTSHVTQTLSGDTLTATTSSTFHISGDLSILPSNGGNTFELTFNSGADFTLNEFSWFASDELTGPTSGGDGPFVVTAYRDSVVVDTAIFTAPRFTGGVFDAADQGLTGVYDRLVFSEADNDGSMDLAIDDVDVTILPPNNPPDFTEGASTSLVIDEDSGAADIDALLAIDDGDSGDSWDWSVASGPSNGTLGGFSSETSSRSGSTVTPSGLTYTPDPDFNGSDSFEIRVSDGTDTDTITVTVTVNSVPDVIDVAVADGTFGIGDPVTATVTFDEAVTVDTGDGTPTLGLDIGGTVRQATYASGSGGTTLTFTYTVTEGDTDDTDGIAIADDALSLNGGTITDADLNAADITHAGISGSGERVDATRPTAAAIVRQSPTNATTDADSVTFRVTFSEDMNPATVEAADFALSGTAAGDGIIGAPVQVSGDPAAYDVTITGIASSNGTLNLDIAGGATLEDAAGNALTDATVSGADETYTMANNDPPTVTLADTTTSIDEDADTSSRVKVADIQVADDGAGTNDLALSGADAGLFEIDGNELFIRAGVTLDHETNGQLDVTVKVDDASVGASPDDTASLAITVNDVNEAPTATNRNQTITYTEDASSVAIGDIVVSDPDAAETISATLLLDIRAGVLTDFGGGASTTRAPAGGR